MTNKKIDTLRDQSGITKMRDVNISDIDKNTLTDIASIKIDTKAPVEERVRSFIEKAENPYCLLIDGCIVKSSFSNDEVSIYDRLSNGLLNTKDIGDK